MRQVIFSGACTLDGYLARTNNDVDWLLWSDEVAEHLATFWTRFDTVLMGRKTYDVAATSGQAGGSSGVDTFVFSRTLSSAPEGVTLVREDAAEFVRRLKTLPGKDICLMGGGDFARALFEADLIDEVGLNVHPVLIGRGIPSFHPMSTQIDLELQACQQLSTGCVLLTYRVRHAT